MLSRGVSSDPWAIEVIDGETEAGRVCGIVVAVRIVVMRGGEQSCGVLPMLLCVQYVACIPWLACNGGAVI